MNTLVNVNWVGWRSRIAEESKFLRRWAWYIALCVIAITLWSYFLPDLPSVTSYEATLQVQVIVPVGLSDPGHVNQTTTFYTNVLVSPDVLNLALPKLQKIKQFSSLSLSSLQSLVTVTAVKNSAVVLLNAISDTPQDASLLATTVYNSFLQKINSKRSPIIQGLNAALYSELTQAQDDAYNTSIALQNLRATGQGTSFQSNLLGKLHIEQQAEVDSINALLLTFSQQGAGPNSDFLTLISNTPTIKTIAASAPTYPLRLLLSVLIGLMMGVSGALLAQRFSNRLPLRGKKRDLVLPHVATIIPTIPDLRKRGLTALQQEYALALPLVRRLRYQASEHEMRLKFITVTSPRGREGKSTVATLLALAAAQSGLRTLLIDANPTRPVLHSWFHVPNVNGTISALNAIASGLVGASPIVDTSIPKLSIAPIGKKDPTVRLQELRMDSLRSFLDMIGGQADLIIFDAPSLLTDANTTNLVMFSDLVMLVVDARKSNSAQVVEAEEALTRMKASSATVLNRAQPVQVE